jgi:hypothetical protein
VLPGLRVVKGAFVAAGGIVSKEGLCMTLVKENSGMFTEVQKYVREENVALSGRRFIDV